jgi:hypothetical protein
MRTPSQSINPSYGYLTWLNGQSSFMLPSVQFSFTGSPMPNAPSDLYAALGKDGQIINVAPSDGLVLIRMGSSMGASLVGNQYNDTIWQYMNRLNCPATILEQDLLSLSISSNPNNGSFTITGLNEDDKIEIFNSVGQAILFDENSGIFEISKPIRGLYFVHVERMGKISVLRLIVE